MKILSFKADYFLGDLKNSSKELNQICHAREQLWSITGMIQNKDRIFFLLDESTINNDYILAYFSSESEENVIDEIKSHWQSDLLLKGYFNINQQCIALFLKK